MNVALMDYIGDGYGVFADEPTALAHAERLLLRSPWTEPTTAPVNDGNDPENVDDPTCLAIDGSHFPDCPTI